jgi:type I restriction enzyme S subunit
VDTEYLYWLTRNPSFWPKRGSAQPFISQGDARGVFVALPTISEQRAIASILGALDDKIELNRKISATLEAMARALFKSWFVDFDPVRAKAEGRDPGLPPEIAALFPDSFEDSELGEIPKGWRVVLISNVADITTGKRPSHRFPTKTIEHAVEVWGGNGPMAYTVEPLLSEPLLLTGRVGTLGSVFKIYKPIWPSDNTLVVRPHRSFFEYAFFALRSIDYTSLTRGSTQPLLTQGDLKNQKIVLPSSEVVTHFSMVASALFARIEAASSESQILASLRDVLLPKLISGEIRVPDAERLVEQTA